MKIKSICVLMVLFFGLIWKNLPAQTVHNNDLWVTGHGNMLVNDKWGADLELHYRMAKMGQEKQQFLVRPSMYYVINSNVLAFVGYTHIETYPYGEQPIAFQTPENNYWTQVLLKHSISKINVSHRYRYESRWTGNITNINGAQTVENYTHRNRFRYRITFSMPINDTKFSLKAFDELWINFGENVANNGFDQNWLYMGASYSLNKQLSTGFGYMWQVINKPDGVRHESNNTVQITLNYKIKINK